MGESSRKSFRTDAPLSPTTTNLFRFAAYTRQEEAAAAAATTGGAGGGRVSGGGEKRNFFSEGQHSPSEGREHEDLTQPRRLQSRTGEFPSGL